MIAVERLPLFCRTGIAVVDAACLRKHGVHIIDRDIGHGGMLRVFVAAVLSSLGGLHTLEEIRPSMSNHPRRYHRGACLAIGRPPVAPLVQAFAGLFALLLFSLVFEVYVYMSGGITNGSTRFQDIGQPT